MGSRMPYVGTILKLVGLYIDNTDSESFEFIKPSGENAPVRCR